MKAKKIDPEKFPLHMRGDAITRNDNIDKGEELCDRCEGTGNELFSMYMKCHACNGTGVFNNSWDYSKED